jgi:MoxR-like ATPase
MQDWKIFTGNGARNGDWELPEPPSWRPFGKESQPGESRRKRRGETFVVRDKEIKMVNAALYLRRPLLVTGKPGTGKSSLAYKVAQELNLGQVLYWPITTHTTLKDGLYNYDAIGRLQEVKLQDQIQSRNLGELTEEQIKAQQKVQLKQIEKYITLGPLGTALLPSDKPRMLLIDEIDKSDIDLPNDLLTLFEEGRFEIPELVRLKEEVPTVEVRTVYTDTIEEVTKKDIKATITNGLVTCNAFPFVILTSNGERDFPPPFLRRCLRLTMTEPEKEDLIKIVEAHLEETISNNEDIDQLINDFINKRNSETLATDQLLNAIFMVKKGAISTKDDLIALLLKDLGAVENE